MAADDDIHAERGIELCREELILLKTDVGEENRAVDVDRVVGIADALHLACRIANAHEAADQRLLFRHRNDRIGDNTDEENAHAVDFHDVMRLKACRRPYRLQHLQRP